MKVKVITFMFIFLFFLLFISKPILGVTIVLDPGHGAKDTGAINYSLGLYERNQVWKIANYLKGYLEQYEDTRVCMTYSTYTETGETLSRADRGDLMKAYNADLGISLHIDSSKDTTLRGATAYVTGYSKYNASMTKLGQGLLNNLSKLGIKSNGVKTRPDTDGFFDDGIPLDYYGMLRYPTLHGIPAILLEHCYISNTDDCKFIDSDEDLKKLAKADADAIAIYLKLTKKTETKQESITQDTKLEGVTISNLQISKGYITNVSVGETISKIKANIKTEYTVTITDKDGKVLADTDIIKNCSKLVIKNKDKTIGTYIFTIYGDINCDGIIDSIDLLVLQRHILGISKLEDSILKAGCLAKDGSSPTSIDLLKIQRHILGISKI